MIDFHAHLGKVIHGYPPLTPEELLRFMDRQGIEQSVILPLVAPEEEDYYYTTEQAPRRLLVPKCKVPCRLFFRAGPGRMTVRDEEEALWTFKNS